jgi:hypothetical protein
MIKRKITRKVIGAIAMSALALPLAAFAASDTSGLKAINLQGVGTGSLAAGNCTLPAIPCGVGHTCECLTGAQTVVGTVASSQGFNKGSLTFELSIDETSSPLPISNVGDCLPATGFGSIKNSNGKVTLSLDISGLACPTTEGAAEVFNGTYHVTAGSGGKNPFTTGTGALNGSLAGTVSRTSLNGNVQP